MPKVEFHGGLAGKARRVRERGRASRLYTQQWIDDYLDPEEQRERPRRPIPIRARSEFLPSMFDVSIEEREADRRDVSHSPSDTNETLVFQFPSSIEQPIESAASQSQRAVQILSAPNAPPLRQPTVESLPFERSSKRRPWSPANRRPAVVNEDGDRRGFIFGCLLGSAAAAVLLLAVRFAVGTL